MERDSIDRLVERLNETGVASRDQLRGCSADEIAALEAKYCIVLPDTYRRFLELMGHSAGQLFAHDRVEAGYARVLEMTEEQRRWHHDEPEEQPIRLPDDALIVLGRFDEQFSFIRCRGTADSAIYYYEMLDPAAQRWSPSLVTWLNLWCDEAASVVGSRNRRRDT